MQTGSLKNIQCFRQRGGSLVKSLVYDDTVVETSSWFLSLSSVEALASPSKPGERSCFSELRPRRCSESALDKTSSQRLHGGGGTILSPTSQGELWFPSILSGCSLKTELLVTGRKSGKGEVFFPLRLLLSLLRSYTLHYLSAAAVSAQGSVIYTINPILSCE